MKKLLSILFAFVLVLSFSLVMAIPAMAAPVTLTVTGPGDAEIFSLAEMDQHFSTETIDASSGDTILSGQVALGNFEAGNGNDVWYEIGLVSNETYLGYPRLHNKGVYMIALWTPEYYKVHMQNVPGYENPPLVENYLGDEEAYNDLWGDAGLCYFKVPQAAFQYEIVYRDVTTSSGLFDLRISIDSGESWSSWKYWEYAEDDEQVQYGMTEEEIAAYGYADDDDLTNARIVSQLFTATDTTETFTAVYDNIQVNGGAAYALEPRVLNTNTGKGYAGIKVAIDDASAGDNIVVKTGTFGEDQIVVSSDVTVAGDPKDKPVIYPTTDLTGNNAGDAWFLIDPEVSFDLADVVVDGGDFFVHQAIRNHGNTSIDNVDFRNIQGSESGQPYRGFAIASFGGTVPGGAGSDSHGEGGPASYLAVNESTFEQIGRIGVLVKGSESAADITDCIYTGKGSGDWLDYAFEAGGGGDIDVEGCTVTACKGVAKVDGSTSAAILVTTYYGPTSHATITGNILTGNSGGIAVGYDEADTSVVVAHFNDISGNDDFGVDSTAPAVDAENNWWGSANGPTHAGNTFNVGAQGDVVSDNVDYVPWHDTDMTGASFAPVTSEDGDFSSIQAAIDAACGTTITCATGIFSENVDLDKSLVLTSGSLPVINGDTNGDGVPDGSCITVSADEVTIYGFELTNGYNGIIGQTSGSTIQKCIIHDNLNYVGSNGVGILLWGKNDNNQILENVIYNNDRQGIFIGHCDWGEPAESLVSTENIIAGNTIYNNGLYTQKNGPDASVYGIQLWNADFNTIENNEIYGHIGWDLVRDPEEARPFDWSQGIYLCGSYANLVRYNYIHENGTGVGIAFIYRVPGEPNEIHFNNFCGNEEYGIWNRGHVTDPDFDTVNAQNNWWCHASGPSHSPGNGDPVSDHVLYAPWLLASIVPGEPLPTTFDETQTLLVGWTLVSTDNWIDPAQSVGEGVILALNYSPSLGYWEVTPADLVPVNALYLKTEDGGALGINYSEGVPVVSSKELEPGWNLVSSATVTNAKAVLSSLRFVPVGAEQGIGLTTLVSQGNYNLHTASFYLATLTDSDWNALGEYDLNPFDGYWVYMNAPKVFGVIPD